MWSLPALLSVSLVVSFAATPSRAQSVLLDHEGDSRCFDVMGLSGRVDILSRGDGGCLDADMQGTGGTTIFMLGDGVNGQVHDEGGDGSVYMGMCPPGMQLEPVARVPGSTGTYIPNCI